MNRTLGLFIALINLVYPKISLYIYIKGHGPWYHIIVCNLFIFRIASKPTVVEHNPKALFSIATTPGYRGGCYSFPWIAPLTLDLYFIMLSVKHRGIKYHFFSLWYNSTWDWTLVFQAISKHSNHYANGKNSIGSLLVIWNPRTIFTNKDSYEIESETV